MRHSCVFLFFCLFVCAAAYPVDWGTIQCDPGVTAAIPAWVEPGRPHIVAQLSCDQPVSVVGKGSFLAPSQYSARPREYVQIQIGANVAYVDAKYVKLSKTQEPLRVNKSGEDVVAERQNPKEDEEQKKWSLITKDNVKLHNEVLRNPITTYGSGTFAARTFAASVFNNSEFSVSHLNLLVRLYDCSGKPQSDYSNCEIIGEVKKVVPASIPAGQTRRITTETLFDATPRTRDTLGWGYQILGVRAE